MIPADARAAFFDAVGTILYPDPGVDVVYSAAAARFGLSADPMMILDRFKAAFRRQERIDAASGWVTSEERERERWQAIVRETLPGAPDECFDQLYAHFAKPDAWRVPDGAAEVFDALHARGLALGVASNLDARLSFVLAARPELARLAGRVVVSSLVGVRKPGAAFFEAMTRVAGCAARAIVLVGDDFENDFVGATAAGMSAVLLDPRNRHPNVAPRIRGVSELLE